MNEQNGGTGGLGFTESKGNQSGNGATCLDNNGAADGKALSGQPAQPKNYWTPGDWVVSREEVEPWPEPVDGKALLDELAALVTRFVVVGEWVAEALSLWVVHTYGYQLREVAAYLGIESPQHRCGKSTLLDVLGLLVNRPVRAANISPPAFFRVIAETEPTLLIDEADTFLHSDDLNGILNSGYQRKGAFVFRVTNEVSNSEAGPDFAQSSGAASVSRNGRPLTPSLSPSEGERVTDTAFAQSSGATSAARNGKPLTPSRVRPEATAGQAEGERVTERLLSRSEGERVWNGEGRGNGKGNASRLVKFSCWCPKAIARIGRLPQTLADRCIVFVMQRKLPAEKCERLKTLEALTLRRKCARFVRDNAEALAKAQPAVPEALNDRAADIWEPLLAVADLAGGDWTERARAAAVALSSRGQEGDPMGSLLMDILELFMRIGSERLFSRTIADWLNRADARPWAALRKGKAVDGQWLGRQLQVYGIRPRTMRIGEERAKGYEMEDFGEAFRRYIPRAEWEEFKAQLQQERREDREAKEKEEGKAQGNGVH